MLIHKKNKGGKMSKLILCCFDPTFGGEEKAILEIKRAAVHCSTFRVLSSDSGVEDLCLIVYGVVCIGK